MIYVYRYRRCLFFRSEYFGTLNPFLRQSLNNSNPNSFHGILDSISFLKWNQRHGRCLWWKCHSCSTLLLLSSLFLLSVLFLWCAVLTNTPGLRDPVVMGVLSDFYLTLLRALVCLRQTAQRNSVMLSTACWRHVHSAENEFRWQEYRSAIDQIREISLMQWPEPAW